MDQMTMCELESRARIELDFVKPSFDDPDSNIVAARSLVAQVNIRDHRFFRSARASRRLVEYWVMQELFVTNPFTQLLLLISSSLGNVYVRQRFLEVAVGEHGAPPAENVDGEDVYSLPHPELLKRLADHLGIDLTVIEQAPETATYMAELRALCERPMAAMGAIGVGNELLLVEEYGAARDACAESCAIPLEALAFFDVNIEADSEHGALCEQVAMALKSLGHDTGDYLEGARRALEARIRFYDTAADRAGLA